MREDINNWIERLEADARQYSRDDFCDKDAANIAAYDDCVELIDFLAALLNGPVVMGAAL